MVEENKTGVYQSLREVSQKGRNIGLYERLTNNSQLHFKNTENQFVCFMKKITGETHLH